MNTGLRPGILILAGGRGSRCDDLDKGWLEIGNVALVELRIRQLAGTWPIAISANRTLARYRSLGLPVFVDEVPDFCGPLAAISAALTAQFGHPLITVPVDAPRVPMSALRQMLDASAGGRRVVYACDADGTQPLIAVWPADSVGAVVQALQAGSLSVRALQHRLRAVPVEFPLIRFGNINTLADLDSAERETFGVGRC